MAWNLKDKPNTVKATKALAKQFAEMDRVPRERPLSERRLQVYRRIYQKGEFRPVTWASAFCKETGTTYRINGQHTSVLLSGLKEILDFYVTVEEYECDTLDDVARLYSTFDAKIQSRTSRDINLSFAGTIAAIADLSAHVINNAVAGMAYHTWSGRITTTQPAERAELLLEHTDFVLWLDKILKQDDREVGNASAKPLGRQPVVGAMFATWQKDADAASRFWRSVRDETGAAPEMPDRALARFLLTTHSTRGGGSRWGTRHADSREMYAKCLHAWNAWRKGETRSRLQYYPEAELPEVK